MREKLSKVMGELEKLAYSLDIDPQEFGQRAMRTLTFSTGYEQTKSANLEYTRKIAYRRALNLKVGMAAASVFEISNTDTILKEEFIDRTTDSYMRLSGLRPLEQFDKKNAIKGLVTSYLSRIEDLGLISYKRINNESHVKIEPEISSCAFASIMNPESMMRPPYMKAMAQTIGAMSIVDRDQNKWTVDEISDEVQDRLQSIKGEGRLKTRRTPFSFNLKNIQPFHVENNVHFYADSDDENLIILPTFPEPGTVTNDDLNGLVKKLHTPLISSEIAIEKFGITELQRLTTGHNPLLIQIGTGNNTIFFYRDEKNIKSISDFLGTPLSKFMPRHGVITQALIEIQSKLGFIDFNGLEVEKVIQRVLERKIKENNYASTKEREVVVLLYDRLRLININDDKIYEPVDNAEGLLKELKGYCNLLNICSRPTSEFLTR